MLIRKRSAFGSALTSFAVVLAVAACTNSPQPAANTGPPPTTGAGAPAGPPNAVPGVSIPAGQIDAAVSKVDGLANELMRSTGIPGMAVAIVHDGKTVYAKGFGVRNVDTKVPVDPDTVFQLASLAKSVGSTVVAHEVGQGVVKWDTPVHQLLPSFTLKDPYVTDNVTIGDLYAHRSGLPDHAGDLLEDIGYDRQQILSRLKYLPLGLFRDSYEYTNFGLTAAAEAVATASGMDWATLSQQALYGPLGMDATSSRYADFKARADHADGHMRVNGAYRTSVPGRQPDAQSPAGGVSSSVNDMAKWMNMVLADGTASGKVIVPGEALLPAISPQSVSSPPATPDARASLYGFGIGVTNSGAGRVILSHSGGFNLGAATAYTMIPSANVGIVALTNAQPTGIPETLNAEFADLVQFGSIQQDWHQLFTKPFEQLNAPSGSLVGKQAPANPAPPQQLANYAGTYNNDYYGPATVAVTNDQLTLTLGPKNNTTLDLRHWDGNTFVFVPPGENSNPGSISKATFDGNKLVLEFYDNEHLGTFTR